MAGHGIEDDPNLKGLSRIFNAETNRGRANVSESLYPIVTTTKIVANFLIHTFRQFVCNIYSAPRQHMLWLD